MGPVPAADDHRALFARIPLPMWVYDPATLRFLEVNEAAVRRYGHTRDEFLTMSLRDIRPRDDVDRLERHVATGGGDPEALWRHVTSEGEIFDVRVASEEVTFHGRPCRLVVAEDVTEQLRAQDQLAHRAAMQAAVANLGVCALEGMEVSALMDEAAAAVSSRLDVELTEVLELASDRESMVLRAGCGWDEGLVREAMVPFGSAFHAGFAFQSTGHVVVEDFATELRFAAAPLLARQGAASGAMVIIGRRGRPYGVLGAYARRPRSFTGDELDFMRSVANVLADAIGRHDAEERIRHQALHDPLTGLPNRTLLMDRLSHWLAHARRRHATGALFFLDLDGFKLVNDALGHEAGDALLGEVARRLSEVLRPTDTIARVGGDEFVAFCEDVESQLDALELVERMLASLQMPFPSTGPDRRVTASIGVAMADHRSDAETLIRSADAAMYRAKERGGERFELFDEQMRALSARWLETERDLRVAVDRDDFHNVYQPIVQPGVSHIVGFEALVRWDHPERGTVAPGEFIPIAEQTGLIVPIGERVLVKACEQAAAWQPGGDDDGLEIAVNLSPRQFSHPGLVPSVEAALEASGLPAALLSLEITETVLMDDADVALQTLERLKALGVRLVLDDFGTGYSSLSHLKRFPIDLVKIDRSFVNGLGDDAGDSAIVSAVISMGRAMGVGIVAEGVETDAQAATLRELGCPLAQGFLFARPLEPDDVAKLMAVAVR